MYKRQIEQFLLNDRKRKLIEEDVKKMRAESKIEYVGKFGEGTPGAAAASAPAAPATPAPAAPAASTGLSSTDISKGMGLK